MALTRFGRETAVIGQSVFLRKNTLPKYTLTMWDRRTYVFIRLNELLYWSFYSVDHSMTHILTVYVTILHQIQTYREISTKM